MLFRSGRIKIKTENNRLAEPVQEIEPDQENFNFKEARKLPNPEVNLSNITLGQSVTQRNRKTIPKIINYSAGHGRGFIWINTETLQNNKQK